MNSFIKSKRGAALVAAILILQAGLFLLSMDAGAFVGMSAFCTGPATSALSWVFGLVHLMLLGLFGLGIVSLPVSRARLSYIGLLAASLLMLILQTILVSHGVLTCDLP